MAAEATSTVGAWQATQPDAAAVWLSGLTVPWWIAGGWALDLFAGSQCRPHQDLDVGILRRDAPTLLAAFASWAVFEAKDGTLTRLHAGRQPRAEVHSLWCRRAADGPWILELMLDEARRERWLYRRDPAIQAPLTQVIRHAVNGIPYLAPEVQLLYKARAVRARDQADFDRIAPRLDAAARTWLHSALAQAEPKHPWLTVLRAT
jgi:hypothetical protein